jgi:hypothetical protein
MDSDERSTARERGVRGYLRQTQRKAEAVRLYSVGSIAMLPGSTDCPSSICIGTLVATTSNHRRRRQARWLLIDAPTTF